MLYLYVFDENMYSKIVPSVCHCNSPVIGISKTELLRCYGCYWDI